MRNLVKATCNSLAHRLDVRVQIESLQRLHPVDVREDANHWSAFLYRTELQPVLIRGALDRGTDPTGFSLQHGGNNPLTKALCEARTSTEPLSRLQTILRNRHDHDRSRASAEDSDVGVDSYPPETGYRFPWSPPEGDDPAREVSSARLGRVTPRVELPPTPLSQRQLRFRARRLWELFELFEADGRARDTEEHAVRCAALLTAEQRWKWVPLGPRDRLRAAAAAAAGLHQVVLQVHRLVYREHVSFWPRVIEGTCSPRRARQLFDRLFDQTGPRDRSNPPHGDNPPPHTGMGQEVLR